MIHWFHNWTRWRLIFAGPYANTYQVRRCLVCGFTQSKTVQGNSDITQTFPEPVEQKVVP